MLKHIKIICRNKKGFTLVELMVSFTLTAIFMTAAVLVMSSFLKVYYRTNNISQSTSVADMLMENISSELSLAKQDSWSGKTEEKEAIRITRNSDGKDTIDYRDKNGNAVQMTVKDGLLCLVYKKQKDIAESEEVEWGYDEKVYLHNVINKLTFIKDKESNIITINMTLYNDKTGYSVNSQRVIECFNLKGSDIIEITGS